jgi:uncharacterized protein (TIGR00369 family)
VAPISIPADFRPVNSPGNPFISANGPLYGRWIDGRFTLGFLVEERHCNPGKTCHGGMISTLADMTLLFGCNLQGGVQRYMLTVSLNIDFLGASGPGDWIEGRCEVLRASKNMVFAQGMLTVGDKPIARLNGIFKPTGEPNLRLAQLFGLESFGEQ